MKRVGFILAVVFFPVFLMACIALFMLPAGAIDLLVYIWRGRSLGLFDWFGRLLIGKPTDMVLKQTTQPGGTPATEKP